MQRMVVGKIVWAVTYKAQSWCQPRNSSHIDFENTIICLHHLCDLDGHTDVNHDHKQGKWEHKVVSLIISYVRLIFAECIARFLPHEWHCAVYNPIVSNGNPASCSNCR